MPEMRVTRRGFLGEALAAFGFAAAGGRTLFAAPKGWKPPKGAKLVFGALSDTHLRTDYTGLKAARTFPHKYLISALEYFRSQNVDAVVHCGDAAHRGQIRELEFHAEAWNKVFPKGLAPDGHRIEKLFVTGNHEIDGWQYGNDVGFKVERVFTDPEERARRILATDIASSWERVWGETYEPVWHKEVKGYHFFGRHYGAEERKIARLVKAVDGELRKAVYAAGGNMGIGHETNGGVTEVEIPNQDLSAGAAAAIAVTPLSSLGTRGRPITINSFRG